jgi:hypothetical protein
MDCFGIKTKFSKTEGELKTRSRMNPESVLRGHAIFLEICNFTFKFGQMLKPQGFLFFGYSLSLMNSTSLRLIKKRNKKIKAHDVFPV